MSKLYPLPDVEDIGQCALCYKPLLQKNEVGYSTNYTTCHGVLICPMCEKQFKRNNIRKPPKAKQRQRRRNLCDDHF